MARSGAIYGLLAFAAGFVLGTLREVVLIPVFGDQAGHLVEFLPLVVLIVVIARQIIVRQETCSRGVALGIGVTGVAVLLVLESSMAIFLFGMEVHEYLAGLNIFRGELFPVGLIIMGLAPVFLAIGKDR